MVTSRQRRSCLSFLVVVSFTFCSVHAANPPLPSAGQSQNHVAKQLKVALAQPLVVPGAVEKNVQNMEPLVVEAVKQGAELVVFSECGITGFDLKGAGAEAAIAVDGPAPSNVSRMARKHGAVIIAGFHERRGDKLHNTAGVFYPDGRQFIQRKHHIMQAEQSVTPIAAAPRKRVIFEVKGFRCALLICSDSGMPGIYEELGSAGCDAIIVITAGAGDESFGVHQAALADSEQRKKFVEQAATCLSAKAIEQCLRLDCAQIACNQAGWDAKTGYFHPGGSSIIDRTGEVTAVIPPRFVFEHLRPDLDVGFVTRHTKKP
jgi:predicted amidohydrolase